MSRDPMTPAEIKALVERLETYRSRNEWGDPVHHTICDEAATALRSFMDGGWRLVPVEPTPEMIDAWHRSSWPKGPSVSPLSQQGLSFTRAYRAMLSASPLPTPPAVEGEASD